MCETLWPIGRAPPDAGGDVLRVFGSRRSRLRLMHYAGIVGR